MSNYGKRTYMKNVLCALYACLLTAMYANAELVVTTEKGAGTGTADFDLSVSPSAVDLADSSQTTFSSMSAAVGNNHPIERLNDGVAGAAPDGGTQVVLVPDTGATFTVNFDISVNSAGYDITGINSFSGWDTQSDGRSNQGYDVTVNFVNGGSQLISSGTYTTIPASTWTGVYISDDDTGVLASGVQSITFSNFDEAQAGGVVAYHEFDVFGTATEITSSPPISPSGQPNVIMIYYDDMGYSDMGAYDTTLTSLTPNLDTLASEGMMFTAGHSADGVCTPSRYALMTGRYCWRTWKKTGVIGGYSAPIMQEDRFTFAKMFQSLGYSTAMVGKWHIGMQFYSPSGTPVDEDSNADVLDDDDTTTSGDTIDFSQKLTDTPHHQGFDYYFGTSASLDMPPYTWIEDDTVLYQGGFVDGDTGMVDFSQAVPATNAVMMEGTVAGVRNGVYDPTFVISDYLEVQAAKVAEIIKARALDGEPFFIYVPMPAPHKPWAVSSDFAGSTSFTYGDYLAQTDHYTGVILDALADPDGNPGTDDSLASNTVVFISSDNGPEKAAQTASLNAGLDGNGPFRGVKRDNWEGGTRVPFIVRWPGVVAPGSTTDHACWQGDFFATMAAYLGYDFAEDEAPDAESFLPILYGNSMPETRREGFIQHSMNGQLAIVDKTGEWKLLDGTGSGGYTATYDADNVLVSGIGGTVFGTPRQLFNLADDPGERTNLLTVASPTQESLDKESELYALLNEIRGDTSYGTDGDSNVPEPDNDLDGMGNAFENTYAGLDRNDPSDSALDFEPDGLTNLEEFQYGSNPLDADSDGDRLEDAVEVYTYGTQAGNAHSDSDTLEDGDEVLIWNTDPLVADTDGDGLDDDDELAAFSDPRNAASRASVPADSVVEIDPNYVQLVGVNGTEDDPAVEGGVSSGWAEAGNLFARERGSSNQQWRTRLFIAFDLGGITLDEFTEARLRVHQVNRLNTEYSSDLSLARVTEAWGTTAGVYPEFDDTGVADSFVFGNNSDFGTAADASGFYSGTVGVSGDDSGFDVTDIVRGWLDGSYSNHGLRIALEGREFAAAAFSESDDLATIGVNEALQLIITTTPPAQSLDGDSDGLLDAYELEVFGNLNLDGADDGDRDEVSALIEQALGSDPTTGASQPILGLVTTNAEEIEFAYHRYNQAGLGVEVLVSEDLTEWFNYTRYYQIADPAPASELGAEYDKILLEPVVTLPERLFYKINVHVPAAE
ncbi:sulfatase-like hydrolase/transferase [Lentimonas sp. CC11]|uniref:sulfatase-like hydrolase/transferase n=2 Tax=Lentimonas TaxID=417293 RepID=UPI001A7E3DDB|nr:sulfatase-like hydrolase/transferase [Lentimonas sp. CC11]